MVSPQRKPVSALWTATLMLLMHLHAGSFVFAESADVLSGGNSGNAVLGADPGTFPHQMSNTILLVLVHMAAQTLCGIGHHLEPASADLDC